MTQMNKKNINLFEKKEGFRDKLISLDKDAIIQKLEQLLETDSLQLIKNEIGEVQRSLFADESNQHKNNPDTIYINFQYILDELKQIIETQTLQRIKYYIQRLIKSLTEIRTNKANDINLNRWKEYDDLLTDSLWILNGRDKSGVHNGSYWGNFIPQIPNQLMRRFTKKNDWILDTFLGSGTTLIECKRLGRNGLGIELQENIAKDAKQLIEKEITPHSVKVEVINDDSTKYNFKDELRKKNINSVQLVIMHPPYWDIIKFSEDKQDLSNAATIQEFLDMFGQIVKNVTPVLEKSKYLAVVIGDKYSGGELIPLGFLCMQEVLKQNYKLKSIIVKNFEETKGKQNQKELWRYRALVGGFYIFKHEYILLFQK